MASRTKKPMNGDLNRTPPESNSCLQAATDLYLHFRFRQKYLESGPEHQKLRFLEPPKITQLYYLYVNILSRPNGLMK